MIKPNTSYYTAERSKSAKGPGMLHICSSVCAVETNVIIFDSLSFILCWVTNARYFLIRLPLNLRTNNKISISELTNGSEFSDSWIIKHIMLNSCSIHPNTHTQRGMESEKISRFIWFYLRYTWHNTCHWYQWF